MERKWKEKYQGTLKEGEEKKSRMVVVLLAFTLASLEISFWPTKKNCLTEEVYYFGGNVKTRLDIEAR